VEGDAAREAGESRTPRLCVVRSLKDAKTALAMLVAGWRVLFVLRADDAERQRVLDLLSGWSIGSGGLLDRIGPNTVAACPPGAGGVHVARDGFVSALDEVFGSESPRRLTRDEEDRLIPLAAAGSVEAQRRIVHAYAELATAVALWLRPRTMGPTTAVLLAQRELDELVRWPPRRGTLLTALIRRIESSLAP
jgi:hypothetical protein